MTQGNKTIRELTPAEIDGVAGGQPVAVVNVNPAVNVAFNVGVPISINVAGANFDSIISQSVTQKILQSNRSNLSV